MLMPRWNAVVFVHGCFWHRHKGCAKAATPSTNRPFWAKKFRENVERDRRNVLALRREGWRVYMAWERRTGERTLSALIKRITA